VKDSDSPARGGLGQVWHRLLPLIKDEQCAALGAHYAAIAAGDSAAEERLASFVGNCLSDGTTPASLLATHGSLEDGMRRLAEPPLDLVARLEWRLGLDQELRLCERKLVAALFSARRQSQSLGQLSVRERDVLSLLADGLGNEEIARRLILSPETVRTYAQRAINKLGASNKVQAVAVALRVGAIN
jgi:DNA-binding CsgD family transcriptional regulator